MALVTTSPQISTVAVLRPFENFEAKYQGLTVVDNPISIPGTLDSLAGTAGYDPNLVAGARVPIGSKVFLWVPRLNSPVYGDTVPDYQYQLVWRIRSLEEQNADAEDKLTGNFGIRYDGVPQVNSGASTTPAVAGGPRYVIPAAVESIQTPATTVTEPQVISVNTAMYQVVAPSQYHAAVAPNYIPGGQKQGHAVMLSQGYYPDANGTGSATNDDNRAGYNGGPQYDIIETVAKGNELVIYLTRVAGVGKEEWDFASSGLDQGLSIILGNGNGKGYPGLGIYLLTGATA